MSNLRGGKTESLLKPTSYVSHLKKSSQKFIDKIPAGSSKFSGFASKILQLQQRFFSEKLRVSRMISKIRALFVSSFKNFGGRDVPSRFRKENLSEGAIGFSRFIGGSAEHREVAKRFRKKFSERGAILIEFAVAMPVLIILMMYIHDLALMKRYYDQMDFVTLQMVQMIQAISAQKAKTGNPAITQTDLQNAMRAAYLTVYPGLTQYGTGPKNKEEWYMPFGHFPHCWLYYVVGTGTDKISTKWCTVVYAGNPIVGVGAKSGSQTSQHSGSSLKYTASGNASNLYKNLKIANGEAKLILECSLFYCWNDGGRFFSDGRHTSSTSTRQAFGFFLLPPTSSASSKQNFFTGVVVFSPYPNAFSSTPPK